MRAAPAFLCLLVLLLPGCAALKPAAAAVTAVESISVPATAAPTPDKTALPTAAPTVTPEPSPTPTPAPSPTAWSTATPAPEQSGPAQAVVVIASGHTAKVSFYERTNSEWVKLVDTKGCVGKAGITPDKREGDKKTPKGIFPLTFAFGVKTPETRMEFRPITDESYWVDDAASEYYNTWQEGYKGWKSAEKLSEYADYYRYAVAIGYNQECTPGMGSAIFLHCKRKAYTTGCVAIPESALLEMLKLLDPDKNPVIVIVSGVKEAENYGILGIE